MLNTFFQMFMLKLYAYVSWVMTNPVYDIIMQSTKV